MPACPYGPHRLALAAGARCRHCGGDLTLYAAVKELPALLYNQALERWRRSGAAAAAPPLHAALALRDELPQAHWLMAAVEAAQGRTQAARRHLARARELGAEVDLDWLPAPESRRRRRRKAGRTKRRPGGRGGRSGG